MSRAESRGWLRVRQLPRSVLQELSPKTEAQAKEPPCDCKWEPMAWASSGRPVFERLRAIWFGNKAHGSKNKVLWPPPPEGSWVSHQAYWEHSWIQSSCHTLASSGIIGTLRNSGIHSQRPWALLRAFHGWNLSRIKPPFLTQKLYPTGSGLCAKIKNSINHWTLSTGSHIKSLTF